MNKINLKVWIVLQGVICLAAIPLAYFFLLKNKHPLLFFMITLAGSIAQGYLTLKVEDGSDERSKEIQDKIEKRIGGLFESLCIFVGMFLFIPIYVLNRDAEFVVKMVKPFAIILLISVPVLEFIKSVLFLLNDRK